MDGVQVPYIVLKYPAGYYRNGTAYQSMGRWYDGDGVRFLAGTIRPIGGWRALTDGAASPTQISVSGTARAMLPWQGNDGKAYLGIGTNTKLYVFCEGALTDATPTAPTALTTTNSSTTFSAGGWDVGQYNAGGYGVGSVGITTRSEPGVWTLDNYGEDLVAVLKADGHIWYWDRSAGGEAAVIDASAPTSCSAVVVTPERFIVALGAGGISRYIQWASQETVDTWSAAATNSAGDFTLSGKGKIMCGRRAKSETLIWTDNALWGMRYIGGTLVYSFVELGSECGITARNAVAMVGDSAAIWMGRRSFFVYDGSVREIPCDVLDYVFDNFNTEQREKVVATTRSEYGEVWWYYPSLSSNENDGYVCYNYQENHWSFGSLARTADADRIPFDYPIAIDSSGDCWEHEAGSTRTGVTAYIEGGPMELGDGTVLQQVLQVIPDEKSLGDVSATVYGRLYPTADASSQSVTLANPTDVRFTARQVRVRYTEVEATDWRVGNMRLKAVPAGER